MPIKTLNLARFRNIANPSATPAGTWMGGRDIMPDPLGTRHHAGYPEGAPASSPQSACSAWPTGGGSRGLAGAASTLRLRVDLPASKIIDQHGV